jgi:hypothetical protein
MRVIKIVGLAFLASLAISVVASASASAETVTGIFECAEGTASTGLGSNCLAGGASEKFTVKTITGAKTTGKAIGSTVFATAAKEATCTGGTGEGIVTGLTEGFGTIKLTGCTLTGGINCQTSGASAKEIALPVSSKIVSYLNSSGELRAGSLGAVRNAANANEATLECGGTNVKIYGSVIGSVTPEDTASLSFTGKLVVTQGVQEIQETTNSLRAKFGSGATEKATEEGTAVTSFALKVEIMG